MRIAFSVRESQEQRKLGTIQRLILTLFLDAQPHGVAGRVQIQARDVPDLFNEALHPLNRG